MCVIQDETEHNAAYTIHQYDAFKVWEKDTKGAALICQKNTKYEFASVASYSNIF